MSEAEKDTGRAREAARDSAMSQHNTGIEWTHIPGYRGETWNPVVGCSVISPGCTNCYAMKMAWRLSGMAINEEGVGNPHLMHYRGTVEQTRHGKPVWTGKVAMAGEDALAKPLRWAKPRAIFVNSMGDLFHEDVPDAWIDRVFAIMALCPQHIFIVLTKRAERMRAYMNRKCARGRWPAMDYAAILAATGQWNTPALDLRNGWPLANVWLGVSAEDQTRADARIPNLLATPAAVRFVSAEPLLGPVDLRGIVKQVGGHQEWTDALTGETIFSQTGCIVAERDTLDWVIAGGESGPGARPMHPDWARGLRDQCNFAGVPFFFKQWGEWAPFDMKPWRGHGAPHPYLHDGTPVAIRHRDTTHVNGQAFVRLRKALAGHQLDGETHHNWPEVG